jgi:Fe-S-cluster-containing dehydrogenase component
MTSVNQRVDVPVTIDESLCIEGCTLCVEICPLDSLAINPENGKAFMHVDECWYCPLSHRRRHRGHALSPALTSALRQDR